MTMHHPQPERLQYVKGGRMESPNGLKCVYVGRPTIWANPYKVGVANTQTREEAVEAFRRYIRARPRLIDAARRELKGKNLCCWCPPDGRPCHADVLLEIANAPVSTEEKRIAFNQEIMTKLLADYHAGKVSRAELAALIPARLWDRDSPPR